MKKQRILLIAALLVLSILVVASAAALAKGPKPPPPEQQVLQKDDLPEDARIAVERRVTSASFRGPEAPANVPLQAEGFLEGYRFDAWYPCILQSHDGQSMVYVLHIVYQFQDKAQAAAALERQLAFYENYKRTPEYVKVDAVDLDETFIARNGVSGKAMRVEYSVALVDGADQPAPLHQGDDYETYYFHGVKGDTLIFLMVDSFHPPDPATREVFDDLVPKVVQR